MNNATKVKPESISYLKSIKLDHDIVSGGKANLVKVNTGRFEDVEHLLCVDILPGSNKGNKDDKRNWHLRKFLVDKKKDQNFPHCQFYVEPEYFQPE